MTKKSLERLQEIKAQQQAWDDLVNEARMHPEKYQKLTELDFTSKDINKVYGFVMRNGLPLFNATYANTETREVKVTLRDNQRFSFNKEGELSDFMAITSEPVITWKGNEPEKMEITIKDDALIEIFRLHHQTMELIPIDDEASLNNRGEKTNE